MTVGGWGLSPAMICHHFSLVVRDWDVPRQVGVGRSSNANRPPHGEGVVQGLLPLD